MKKFILTRKMIYTEKTEVEAEDWEDAELMIFDDDVKFEHQNDDYIYDSSIKYAGEVD